MGRVGRSAPSHAPAAFGSRSFKNHFTNDLTGRGGEGAPGLVVLVQMLLSSSEWKLKARACALSATCSRSASDLGWVRPVG